MTTRKRKENETFKAYRQNLKNEEYLFKSRVPNVLWDSRNGPAKNAGYGDDGKVIYIRQ